MIIKEHQPKPLPFSCNASCDSRMHLQGFGRSSDNQTLTLLQNAVQKQTQSGSFEIGIALDDDAEVVRLQMTCNLKKSDHSEFTEALVPPIGSFDLDKTQGVTIELDKKYQRSYRFVKLVPVGFRRGPINFARTKFHSKQAEIQFFGINGYEIPNQAPAVSSSIL